MPAINDLKRLTGNDIAFAVISLLSTIGPGILVIALFRPDAIERLDSFKLALIAIALTLPIVALNFIFIAGAHPHLSFGALPGKPSEADRAEALNNAMALTFVVYYSSLAITFFAALSFKEFLLVLAAIQFSVLLVLHLAARARKRSSPQKQ